MLILLYRILFYYMYYVNHILTLLFLFSIIILYLQVLTLPNPYPDPDLTQSTHSINSLTIIGTRRINIFILTLLVLLHLSLQRTYNTEYFLCTCRESIVLLMVDQLLNSWDHNSSLTGQPDSILWERKHFQNHNPEILEKISDGIFKFLRPRLVHLPTNNILYGRKSSMLRSEQYQGSSQNPKILYNHLLLL